MILTAKAVTRPASSHLGPKSKAKAEGARLQAGGGKAEITRLGMKAKVAAKALAQGPKDESGKKKVEKEVSDHRLRTCRGPHNKGCHNQAHWRNMKDTFVWTCSEEARKRNDLKREKGFANG